MSKLMDRHPDKAAKQIDQLQSISTQALEELRHLISDLRPSHLDDLGLVAALRWYAEQVDQRSTTHIDFETRGEAFRLPPETETTLFRIAQESLGNVIKHANARNAHCLLSFEPGSVQLVIRDDGSGFESSEVFRPGAGRAWGLIGIQERAGLTGGELQIDSSPGQGTTISVRITTTQTFEPSQAG
jgi:signal transduction histidine kinase